jgi:hypothetical protein
MTKPPLQPHVDVMSHEPHDPQRTARTGRNSGAVPEAAPPDPSRRWLIPSLAIAIGLAVPARLYERKQLALMVLIGVLIMVSDRLLTRLADLLDAAALRKRGPQPTSRQPTAPTTPGTNHTGTTAPGQDESQPSQSPQWRPSSGADESLRPLVFVQQTTIGSMPWQLPRKSAQSGVAADQAQAGDLAVRAASIVGAGHRYDAERAGPRQDSYQLALDGRRRFLMVAVADGVSSAAHSEIGAHMATVGAIDVLGKLLHEQAKPDAHSAQRMFQQIAYNITGEAQLRRSRPADYATTLLVAAIPLAPSGPDGGRTVWLSWLADSTAWLLDEGGWRQRTGAAKEGLDRNTLDACLPHNADHVQTAMVDFPAGQALALMTDGLGDLLTDVGGAREELAKRWAAPPSLPAFLRDMCFDAPGQDDDRTAVVVWSPPAHRT